MNRPPLFVFLDFDGVLHPEDEDGYEPFERNAHFHSFLRAVPEARVVFSTTWRYRRSLQELAVLACQGGGADLAARFVGKTPDLDYPGLGGWREAECLAWLAENGHAPHAPWLAIDDHPEWFNSPSRVYGLQSRLALRESDLAPLRSMARSILGQD